MNKLHFICGHNQVNRGATGRYQDKEISEWQYSRTLMDLLNTSYRFTNASHVTDSLNRIDLNSSVALEFHLNSFETNDVEGYELLVMVNDKESLKKAQILLDLMKIYFPERRNRGIKLLSSNDRGYKNLLHLKKYYRHAFISELFFINNPSDYIEHDKLANVLNTYHKLI